MGFAKVLAIGLFGLSCYVAGDMHGFYQEYRSKKGDLPVTKDMKPYVEFVTDYTTSRKEEIKDLSGKLRNIVIK